MPVDRDLDVLALYVDPEEARLDAGKYEIGGNRAAKDLNNAAIRQSTATGQALHPDQVESRTALRVARGERLSFGTYFNGFPASYWRRWTVVTDVTLTVERRRPRGHGDRLQVHRRRPLAARRRRRDRAPRPAARSPSSSRSSPSSTAAGTGTTSWPATRTPWSSGPSGPPRCPTDRAEHGTADIAITTMNRPDFCAKLLGQMADDETLRPYLDTVFVMEQGTDKVVDSEFTRVGQSPWATCCASSSRATSAARAAMPAASSSRCARAPRRTR